MEGYTMQITDLSQTVSCSQKMTVRQYHQDGTVQEISKYILQENLLEVFMNEQLTLQMVCTACNLPALVVGHLYSEGMIESIEEIENIYICENATRAKVFLNHSFARRDRVLEVRACDCGADGVLGRNLLSMEKEFVDGQDDDSKQEYFPEQARDEAKDDPATIEGAFRLIEEFAKESPLHEQTHGTHSAYLSKNGKLLYKMEDIGRHNALDKVIGKALLDGVDLKKCMIFTSGRVPVDMIQKVIRSQVPVLVSNTVPTDKALILAEHYGVRVFTSAKNGHMDEFVHCNERIKVVK